MQEDERMQQYLRHVAGGDVIEDVPGFTVHINRADPLIYFNYAIPSPGFSGDGPDGAIDRLIEVFDQAGRQPRLEWIESIAPDLLAGLESHGFELEIRTDLMICSPDGLADLAAPEGFTTSPVDADSPADEIRQMLAMQRSAFGIDPPTDAQVEEYRANRDTRGFGILGFDDGQPVSAATVTDPQDGLAEVGGIATVESARRRGFGTAITREATGLAFERGVEIAFLSPGDPETGRVYSAVGFRPELTVIACSRPGQ